jgi:glycosyltransferase involved in cell wall biosynthesis
MEKTVKISLVTPCFNSEKTIRDTLESVEKQNYSNLEHIIVDGMSTDETLNIVNEYKNRVPYAVKVVSEKDNGIYDAMNKGIRMATGELVAIINSDDWYEPDAIEKILSVYQHQKYEIVYGMVRLFQDEKIKEIQYFSHEFMLQHMICHPSCFITRAVYEDFGGFDLKYRSSSDYDWMLKRYSEGKTTFTTIYEIIANMRVGGMSSSNLGYRETLKLQLEYKQIPYSYYLFYTIKSYVGDVIRKIRKGV